MKNFIVDNQLPRALVEFLIEQGHHAQHVMDLGMDEATDHSIWLHAQKHELIIVSKDEDFLNLVCQANNKAKFVWVRLGNCRKKFLLDTWKRLLPSILSCLEAGDSIVELR